MRVEVRLLGHLLWFRQDRKSPFVADIADGSSVFELASSLGLPQAEIWLAAVNADQVSQEYLLKDGDRVDFVPVVSGGHAADHRGPVEFPVKEDLELARREILDNGWSVVAVKNGEILGGRIGRGVRPFVELVSELGESLRGATLGDRVIGRSVAMVAAHVGFAGVYARLISQGALEELSRRGVTVARDSVTDAIKDRTGTGICPTEKLAIGQDDSEAVFDALKRLVGYPLSRPGE